MGLPQLISKAYTMSIEELRDLFPDRSWPTEEEIAQAHAAREQQQAEEAQRLAEIESRKQSLRDREANLASELESIRNELASFEAAPEPTEEAQG